MIRGLEGITGVASTLAPTMGTTKLFGVCWQFILLISVALIVGPATMDPNKSSLKQFWSFLSGVADTGRPNLVMLRMGISMFAMASPWKTQQIAPCQKVKGMTYDQIQAALRFVALMLGCLKHYLWTTLTAKENGYMVILWVYMPLTQWLV
jgi:hypothetical protein